MYLRTVLVPVRFRSHHEAMATCQQLGGKYLENFPDFARYLKFYNLGRSSPAMERHCDHGGRFIMWLPYLGWADLTQPLLNVTHYGTGQPLSMSEAWRSNNPRSQDRPFCVVARLGNSPGESWLDGSCDLEDSQYGWDRAPCTACTSNNNVLHLRGVCDR